MSDNISPDEIKRRLIIFLRIPTEVWTDVFKLLSRRVLVQQIAPTCYRFKEISNTNVKNVHVIENANQFTKKLEDDDPEANQQLEYLAANDCQLAGQFELSYVRISEKSQAILRHPDLFNGCKIELYFEEKNKNSTLFSECLSQLEEAKPVEIYVRQRVNQVIDYWHHPTFKNCTRAVLFFAVGLSSATTTMNIFDWLHHQPNGEVEGDGSADQQVRSMIIFVWGTGKNHLDWLINRCSEDIQQGRERADRRPFVLSFYCWFWTGYDQFRRIENNLTGEMLILDRVMRANGLPICQFRLRRCLAEEEASGQEFYAGLFKRDERYDEFKIGENKPRVMIE